WVRTRDADTRQPENHRETKSETSPAGEKYTRHGVRGRMANGHRRHEWRGHVGPCRAMGETNHAGKRDDGLCRSEGDDEILVHERLCEITEDDRLHQYCRTE